MIGKKGMIHSYEVTKEAKESMESRLIELVSSLYVDDDSRDDQVEVLPEDLKGNLGQTPEAIRMLKTVEIEWQRCLSENPHLRPRGGRASRRAVLESKLRDTLTSQVKAEYELQRQLDFFLESREALEDNFAIQVEEAESVQRIIQSRIDQQLDRIALSDHLMQQVVRYETFLETVDIQAVPYIAKSSRKQQEAQPQVRQQEQDQRQDEEQEPKVQQQVRNRGMEPSARAMALIDPNGDDDDVRLRAFRMDHALYCAELKILEKESERIQLNNDVHAFVGKFLTEHNVWGILNRQQQKQQQQHQKDKKAASPTISTYHSKKN
jgi:hypothetical protein